MWHVLFNLQRVLLLSFFGQTSLSLMCLDSNGNNVDWYSVYKSPKIHSNPDWKVKAGLAHFYLDVHSPQWVLSGQPMNASQHAIYNTLEQIYKPQGTLMYIMYNDESPDKCLNSGGGHTKGVVAFDSTSGFWLVHSVPRFPPLPSDGYDWPCSAEDYGQTFMCVSLPYQQLGKLARQLLFNQPDVYANQVPEQFVKSFPILKDVVSEKRPPGPPWSSIQKLTSAGGQDFISFAKANYFHADLYDALVAPTLKQNLLVETWLRQMGTPLDSNCTATYKVLKINKISLPNGVVFKESKDHAKWAVTSAKKSQNDVNVLTDKNVIKMMMPEYEETWACVGDINRMDSQFTRGGGTLCIRHSGVWQAYTNAIGSYSPCK